MQVGRMDDAVDCKSNYTVETPHPDVDYLPLLMISIKLLCRVVVQATERGLSQCAPLRGTRRFKNASVKSLVLHHLIHQRLGMSTWQYVTWPALGTRFCKGAESPKTHALRQRWMQQWPALASSNERYHRCPLVPPACCGCINDPACAYVPYIRTHTTEIFTVLSCIYV